MIWFAWRITVLQAVLDQLANHSTLCFQHTSRCSKEKALASTDLASGTAMSPTAVYDGNTGYVYLSSDPSSVWATSAKWSGPTGWGNSQFVYGNSVMWGASGTSGSSVMWGANGLWGSSVMWGANTTSGFSTIWSNSVMWGASGNWASSVMWGASVDDGE